MSTFKHEWIAELDIYIAYKIGRKSTILNVK